MRTPSSQGPSPLPAHPGRPLRPLRPPEAPPARARSAPESAPDAAPLGEPVTAPVPAATARLRRTRRLAWAPPAGPGTRAGATPVAPTAVPFSYPPSLRPDRGGGPPEPPGRTSGGTPGKVRAWLPVAIVAALIGGAIGAGVTALADNNNSNGNGGVTIHESNAAPGAAVLSGNVTIPQLVNKVIPAVVSIDVKSNGSEDEGTGMIITSDGEVITNNHVIELYSQGGNTGTITVTEYGQTKALPTTLVGYDQSKDVALLKINNASNLPTVTFGNSSKAVVGDAVVAIGNALGLAAGTPTVTQGIVSALGRSVTAGGEGTQTETLQNMIQTDAAINPGQLGRPPDRHVGPGHRHEHRRGGDLERRDVVAEHRLRHPDRPGRVAPPRLEKGGQSGNGGGYLGVDITTLTPALRQQYGFTPTSGAVILSVVSGSPAAKAGLVQGDVIVNIDGTPITSADDLQKVIQNSKAGQTVTITYYVGDSKRTTTATLGSQPQAQQQQTSARGQHHNPFGGGGFPGFGNSGNTGGDALTGQRPRRDVEVPVRVGRRQVHGPPFGCHPLASMSSSTCAML